MLFHCCNSINSRFIWLIQRFPTHSHCSTNCISYEASIWFINKFGRQSSRVSWKTPSCNPLPPWRGRRQPRCRWWRGWEVFHWIQICANISLTFIYTEHNDGIVALFEDKTFHLLIGWRVDAVVWEIY